MNLPEALRKQKEGFLQKASPETVEVMQNAIKELASSGIVENSLKAGATAPDFTLENSAGGNINLYDSLRQGPVILSFFRGDW